MFDSIHQNDPLSVKTRFASAVESTKRGAEGLCSAMTNCFDDMGLSKEYLQQNLWGSAQMVNLQILVGNLDYGLDQKVMLGVQ